MIGDARKVWARRTPDPPAWVMWLIVIAVLGLIVWEVLLDVGRMGFFWGWWGR